MKICFSFVVCLFSACCAANLYAFNHIAFFRSPFSVLINVATVIAVLIYLTLMDMKRRKIKKNLDEQYPKFFSKN